MLSRSEKEIRVQATNGYEGISIFVIALILTILTYSCWVSHCQTQALNNFDRAMGVEQTKGK